MPRMRTPEGYYTITETTKLLNISNAMVREHVEKGRIHYYLPKNRKHGFYLKKDVDNLANELNAFLNMGDEEENAKLIFTTATEEDLAGIAKIANAIFSPNGSNDSNNITVPNWRHMLLEKNEETQYVLKQGSTVRGFATILPFRPDTDKIEKLFRSETVSEAAVTSSDIETFESGRHIRLYIGAIAIDPEIDKSKRKKYGAVLVRELINKIVDLGGRGVIIDNITALGATHSGIRLLQAFGLHEIEPKAPGKRAFIMDVKESGSHVSMQYKEALQKSKQYHTTNNQS